MSASRKSDVVPGVQHELGVGMSALGVEARHGGGFQQVGAVFGLVEFGMVEYAIVPNIPHHSVEARTCPPIRGAGLGDDVKKLHGRYPDTIPAEESQEMDDNLRVSAR